MSGLLPSVTVAKSPAGWVHMTCSRGHYLEFNDKAILGEGRYGGSAPTRWASVLPEEFRSDVPVVGVIQDPAVPYTDSTALIYVFVKDSAVVFFREDELLEQTSIAGKWPHLHDWLAGNALQTLGPAKAGTAAVKYLATTGDRYCFFTDDKIAEVGVIGTKWSFLPSHFTTGVAAVAVVPEAPRWKYLFVAQEEVIYFTDAGIADGPRRIRDKWPHVWSELAITE